MNKMGKILVIDDEEGIRAGCRRALESRGYDVYTAASYGEGLNRIQTDDYDLVLLDVMMPDGRGIDLLKQISIKDPDTVVVIITGYATVELAVEAIRQGAYDFLSKPFDSELLLITVAQGLEHRQLSRETKRLQAIEKEAEELAREKAEMERLDQFKTEFMVTVAHELRSPISALQSFLLSILKGYVPHDQQQFVLQRAVDRVQELLDLVNDLLTLAATNEEIKRPQRIGCHLAEALDNVLPLFNAQAEAKNITLTVDILKNPSINANPDQIVQIWSNLISNAIKYTAEGGSVNVTLDKMNEWAVGCVEDTGIGIDQKDQAQIFDEFFRTTEAKDFSPLGTGLGLTLVKRIVESYGGEVSVESEAGRGSRFTFRLPIE